MKKIIIAAVAKNYVIGKSSGEIPWHSKEEFKHFKDTTSGFPVIMGRKSFETLKEPLKNRLNIILTKNSNIKNVDGELMKVGSLKEAYKICESKDFDRAFIIGGGQIFEKAIDDADEMIISFMDFNSDGDIFFPKIDLNFWNITAREKRTGYEIVTYVKK